MKSITHYEAMQRGTLDFPAEFYHIDYTYPRYKMQVHWHTEFEIIRVLEGELHLLLNDEEFTLMKGDAAFIPGGTIHGAGVKDCIYESIVFSPSLVYVNEQCRRTVKTRVKTSVFYKSDPTIESIFNAMSNLYIGYEFEFLSGVYKLINDIASTPVQIESINEKTFKFNRIKSVLTLIEENYNLNFTLTQLAERSGMSANYFCRVFKELTQKTPFEYINIYRIDIACEMITLGIENMSEIAYSCGYRDVSSFTKTFRRYKGVAPKAYAKSLENKAH